MRSLKHESILKTAALAVMVLLLTASASFAATATVSLTADEATKMLPDGQSVPMWGLFCGATSGATCTDLKGVGQIGAPTWQPPLIRIQTGDSLEITLTNSLPSPVPTSLMIVGQLGGGLGVPWKVPSPTHAIQGTSWPGAGDTSDPGAVFTPPVQPDRIRSFGTEVASTATTMLPIWSALKAGTYLIESGTHPSIQGPMGLYGVLIVSDTVSVPSKAYPGSPGVEYTKDVPLLLSEIDARQNRAVKTAVDTPFFQENAVRALRNYVSSVSIMNGGSGYSIGNVVTITGGEGAGATAEVAAVSGGAITAITVTNGGQDYATIPSATAAVGTGAVLIANLSLAGITLCSNGAAACYPAAVNYDPRYYLINGIAFDKTDPALSTFPAVGSGSGTALLVRFVNAGLRMHVPSVVGRDMTLVAEDGNVLPGTPRKQSEVFLAAGKTYDVMLDAAAGVTYPVFDRQLSLSTNNQRDGGMQGYIGMTTVTPPVSGSLADAVNDNYFLVPGKTLTVSDPSKGMIANDKDVYGVTVTSGPADAAVGGFKWNPDGTFTYTPITSLIVSDIFTYQANGSGDTATVTLGACTIGNGCMGLAPTAAADSFTSNIATFIQVNLPGVLGNDKDPDRHPLTAVKDTGGTCLAANVTLNADGSISAKPTVAGTSCTFNYHAENSQGTSSTPTTTVTLNFQPASNLDVRVQDARHPLWTEMLDYRWIIEEDRTFHIDASNQVNNTPGQNFVPNLGTNFHTSHMPVVAQGCLGTYSCGFGQSIMGDPGSPDLVPQVPVNPSQVHLDPAKKYYISILPGDGQNAVLSGAGGPVDTDPPNEVFRKFDIAVDCPNSVDFDPGTGLCGHGMGGAPIPAVTPSLTWPEITVKMMETPFPTANISVFVFQDDFPLNGEVDAGGGVDVLATREPGLGGFEIILLDQAGMLGDAAGQPTYDMMGMPLSNSLAGTIDPVTGFDACPISPSSTDGIVGMIVTCPKYEKGGDGTTLSPLAGQALISSLYPGLYEAVANPGADRVARGEVWLQTNTLDGTKPHEAFIMPSEPAYFQEFGPGGFHVSIGFANPAIINARLPVGGTATVTGHVTLARTSRTPDQRIYGTGSYDALGFTQCYVSLGDPAGMDFAFTTCDSEGNFTFSGIPLGDHRITIFDQWNEIIVDGLQLPIRVDDTAVDLGQLPMMQWRTNLSTRTFIDAGTGTPGSPGYGDGVSQEGEPGLTLVPVNVRYRDGSYMGYNNTDLAGDAGFNEIFPFFNWLVLEADTTRYKQTGVHVAYDAGGPADGTGIAEKVASTVETVHLPPELRVPGAVYCDDGDCSGESILLPGTSDALSSTARIDPPWVTTEGWQGFAGQTQFFEFGKLPFEENENGGIRGHVVYSSTRPFDDPQLLLQLSWEPLVPNVTVNLYQKGTAPDGTESLTLVDTTKTTSWDDWAQGFRSDGNPNMNCPGQTTTGNPFFFTLKDSTQWLDPAATALPWDAQFKCYDGMAMFGQAQPAVYDGMYQFPSIIGRNPTTGVPTGAGSVRTGSVNVTPGSRPGSNCTICVANPADGGAPMLPAGTYVVEAVNPPGYETVKEEDKNILLGDVYIAPLTAQVGGFGNVFILPDQAEVNEEFNPYSPQEQTANLGAYPRHEGDTGSVESFWPCVGTPRIVPDWISEFPLAQQVSPFAGATRNLCDRKEVILEDQATVLAKFYVFSTPHIAGHFTGLITDDFASEFDPFSPWYGEKFAVPNLPISIKDYTGNEIDRTYSDQWGSYNGLHYSSWEINPPSPSGFNPSMALACMNDPGPILDTRVGSPTIGQMITDPLYNPGYSVFCYESPRMPGQTQYMDTPVVPVMAFAEGYNPPDCAYPDATPAIKRVDRVGGTGACTVGPWVSGSTGVVTAVVVDTAGSGYTSRPTASFNNAGTGGTGAAATNGATTGTFMRVTGALPNVAGNGYRSVPSVSFALPLGPGATVAAATATMKVNRVDVSPLDGGSGYTSVPSVDFPRTGGTAGTFPVTMRVGSIIMSNTGAGYISRPSATFSGGGGTGAAATNGATTGTFLSVTNVVRSGTGGSGYTSAPGVSITAPPCTINGTTCVQAVYTANISGLAVTTFTMVNIGAGYTTRPTVTINNTGSGGTGAAAANAATTGTFLSITRVVVSDDGLNYTSRPVASFTAAPAASPGSTTALAANAAATGTFLSVNFITVTAGGSGYTGVTGTFSGGGGGTGAAAVASLNLFAVNVTAQGSGYTARPTPIIAAPGQFCSPGTNPGAACTTDPICGVGVCVLGADTGDTCTGNGDCAGGGDDCSEADCSSGTTATALAFMSLDQVILSSGGSGYTSAPIVNITPAPGSCPVGISCVTALAHAVISSGNTLNITGLGDQSVPNHAYSGPQATGSPFNQKFITRHYGFGTQCTAPTPSDPLCNTLSRVTIGGVNAPVVSWIDTNIVVNVPGSVPACDIQQQGISGTTRCGELVITAGNGKKSVDTVTVTVGGKPPTCVAAGDSIQSAIDAAVPGDLIIVGPGTYREMLIMWKPVRLQGVGAASVTIFADPHPAGKLDPWRRQVLCLFGLALNGQPISGGNPYDPNPVNPFVCDSSMSFQVDRLPLEPILGWASSLNGNLAELLQEPTLMGAFEGAGITLLGKGVRYPMGADPFGGIDFTFPDGTVRLTTTDEDCDYTTTGYQANFLCNPSRIDGLSITDSSQGGGGIFVHGWSHNLEISNNRIFANTGTLAGGISIGQGEFGDANIDNIALPPLDTNVLQLANICDGASLPTGQCPTGTQLPYWTQANVYVHHNSVTQNASIGDALNSATPGAAGGVNLATGSDNYRVSYNWVCGNLSDGDGGGVGHIGFSYNGDISHNSIIFNQSHNPTIPTHGGGLLVSGAGPDGQTYQCSVTGALCDPNESPTTACNFGADGTCILIECGTITDVDCVPGLSEGAGPGTLVDSNLFQGNTAESGSGGGIRLQLVNGSEVSAFSTTPSRWYQATVQNNIIVNNVAGWDGGGVSMQDALRVNFVNNSVVANDSTASAGALFSSFFAPLSSAPPTGATCIPTLGCTASLNQPAGLATMSNTANLTDSLTALTVTCPTGYSGSNCSVVSLPVLANNVFWQNRSFHIELGVPGSEPQNQQNTVTLDPALNQSATGTCESGASYWDIGVRGDAGPLSHASGFTLAPLFSVLTALNGYSSTNSILNPAVASQYCNGSRVPPENGGMGYLVPPGVAEENIPNPLFTLTPAATVDESNNWINMSYGPLSLVDSSVTPPSAQPALGRYVPTSSSPTINFVTCSASTLSLAPSVDFFGNPRTTQSCPGLSSVCTAGPNNRCVDAGAVEFPAPAGSLSILSSLSINFGHVDLNSLSGTQDLTVANSGTADLTVFSPDFSAAVGFIAVTPVSGTECGTGSTLTLAPGASCTVGIRFAPTSSTGGAISYNGMVTINSTVDGDVPQSVELTGTGTDTGTGTGFCSVPGTAEGTACDDGNACTQTDTCQGGVCTGSNPVICDILEQCHFAWACDPGTGMCLGSAQAQGTPCDDGNPGTCGDVCSSGVCGGTARVQPSEVNASVRLAKSGAGTTIGWSDSSGTYNVYRGSITPGQSFIYNHGCFNAAGPTPDQNVSDALTPPPGKLFYYLVTRVALCNESIPGEDSFGSPIPNDRFCPDQGGNMSIVDLSPSLETGEATAHSGTITVTYTGVTPVTLTAAPEVTRDFGTGAFAITGGTCVSGLTLNQSETCTIVVEYTPPGDVSPSTATLSITGTEAVPGGVVTHTTESFNAD